MIVGMVGFLNSGKGSAGDILVKYHGYHKLNFADSVKDVACAIFGWERYLLEGDTKESREFREATDEWWSNQLGKTVTPRWALQMIGTECFRDVISPELWIKSLERKIQNYNPNGNYVITDVRFRNEIDWIHSKGGKVICVERGERPEWYEAAKLYNTAISFFPQQLPTDVHISEWAWIGSPIDAWIKNNDSFLTLEQKVNMVIQEYDLTLPK